MIKSTRPLTEGGLLAALTLLFGVGALLPVLGAVFLFLMPVPLLLLTSRHGLKTGLAAFFSVSVLLVLFLGPIAAVHILFSVLPAGLMLGWGFYRGHSAVRLFVTAVAVNTVTMAVAICIMLLVTDINPLTLPFDQFRAAMEAMPAYTELTDEQKQMLAVTLETIKVIVPMLFVATVAVNCAISYKVGRAILARLGTRTVSFPAFDTWRFPQVVLLLFGFALVGIYWGSTYDMHPLYEIASNAAAFCFFLGLIEGVSLLVAVLNHYRASTVARIFLFALIFLNGFFLQLVAMFGLVDMIFDYRRRFTRRGGDA